MSGSAAYYINESMSESSGDSLNHSNNGSNNAAKTLQQLQNARNNVERGNGLNLKGIDHWTLKPSFYISKIFMILLFDY